MKLTPQLVRTFVALGSSALALLTVGVADAAPTPSFGAELQEAEQAMPNPEHGARLFEMCAGCHGAHRPGIAGSWIPEIAGQHPRVLLKQLIDYRHGRRWDTRMELIAGRHVLVSTQDIADVVAYASALAPFAPSRVGPGQWVPQGQEAYAERCAECHGRGGEGSNSRAVPRLTGQSYDYLLRQLHDTLEGRRPGLAPVHRPALRRLGMEQLSGLADFLARMQPSPATAERTQRPTQSALASASNSAGVITQMPSSRKRLAPTL